MIFIAVGSNLSSKLFGTPIQNCINAIEILKGKVEIDKVSKFYESEPIPKSDQPNYVNGVVSVKTSIPPINLLSELFNIEKLYKRKRNFKNEPRVIDLDLLCYHEISINSEKLILPHPRMHLRKFVIKPICDINEEWKHPLLKINAKKILKTLVNQKISNIKDLQNG